MSAPAPTPDLDDATRLAVLAAECEKLGHIHLFADMMHSSENGGSTDAIGARDPAQLPHITCRRCGKVWIVVETAGHSYDDAIEQLRGAVTDHKLLAPQARPEVPGITRSDAHGRGY